MESISRDKVMERLSAQKDFTPLKDFDFNTKLNNQLLFFFKPDFFRLSSVEHKERIVDMVLQKFADFKVDIAGACVLSGKILEQTEIMDRHYGYINKLSKNASKMIGDEEMRVFLKDEEITDIKNSKILGGHEFLNEYKSFDYNKLNELWQTKYSRKMRSGFYYQEFKIDDELVVIVNGFHPMQLAYFTNPEHKILPMLLNSNTDWAALKDELVGLTYPKDAVSESIRGTLFRNPDFYGTHDISIANNFVHLSAGAFEGFFEIDNFFSKLPEVNLNLKETLMFKRMKEANISEENIEKAIHNPQIIVDGKTSDLFTETENKNTDEAVAFYLKRLNES